MAQWIQRGTIYSQTSTENMTLLMKLLDMKLNSYVKITVIFLWKTKKFMPANFRLTWKKKEFFFLFLFVCFWFLCVFVFVFVFFTSRRKSWIHLFAFVHYLKSHITWYMKFSHKENQNIVQCPFNIENKFANTQYWARTVTWQLKSS